MAVNSLNTVIAVSFSDLVSEVSTARKYPLGLERHEDGKIYRYVKYDNGTANLASVVGRIAYHILGDWVITMDVSDTDGAAAAGAFSAVIADLGFGWIQSAGVCTLVTDGGAVIVKGDRLIPHATQDGTVSRIALTAGTASTDVEIRAGFDGGHVGVALAAESASTVSAMLQLN